MKETLSGLFRMNTGGAWTQGNNSCSFEMGKTFPDSHRMSTMIVGYMALVTTASWCKQDPSLQKQSQIEGSPWKEHKRIMLRKFYKVTWRNEKVEIPEWKEHWKSTFKKKKKERSSCCFFTMLNRRETLQGWFYRKEAFCLLIAILSVRLVLLNQSSWLPFFC